MPGTDKLRTEVVKLSELREKLPPDTVWVSAVEREAQRAQRLRDYETRIK